MKFRYTACLTALLTICGTFSSWAQASTKIPDNKPNTSAPFKKCWEYNLTDSNGGSLVSSNGTVFFTESEGRIRAISARTSQVNWVSELGGRIVATAMVPKFGLAVVTVKPGVTNDASGGATLRMLNLETGLVKFSIAIETGDDLYLLAAADRLIIADRSGKVGAFNAVTGEKVWSTQLSGSLTAAPAVSSEMVAAASSKNKIEIISMGTGQTIASIAVNRPVTALLIRENQMIVAGDDRGSVTNYRNQSGEVWWRFKSGARIGTIIETRAGILVGSFDNFIYMISSYAGDVKWKRRLDGRIVSEPLVIGDMVLAAASTEESAVAVGLEHGKPVDQFVFGENRFMLSKPAISEGSVVVFGLTDSIVAFSNSGCAAN
ncbi:MAG: PQQ-binding-like beta-propeller repeat protein [Pyrinomonadaceae bacterium]